MTEQSTWELILAIIFMLASASGIEFASRQPINRVIPAKAIIEYNEVKFALKKLKHRYSINCAK
jgi:hypothetical protein